MKIYNLDEVIATRRLTVVGEEEREILVVLGKPAPSTDSIGHRCPFQIRGVGSEDIKYAMGADAIHAIQGALFLIGVDLESLNQRLSGSLRWEGDEEGKLGFPTS
ncbi:MAG: DUF6968 family protein [Pyrinomonadaceae bacterium]